MGNAGSSTDVRDHVLELIDFLSAYDARRHPPVRDIADFGMFKLRESGVPDHPAVVLNPSENAWLTVDFIDLPTPPLVPDHLRPLLASAMPFSAIKEPIVVAAWPDQDAAAVDEDPDGADLPQVSAEESARRSALLAEAAAWVQASWRPWSEQVKLASAVKSLHRQLFEQREQLLLERESVELIWGFGRGRWVKDEYTIDHPLLGFPVEVDLDAETQQICVRPAGAHEVESTYLHGLDLHDRSSFSAVRTASVELDLDPWSGPETAELITRLARFIDDDAVVVDQAEPGADFRADLSWTVFMRRKTPDSQGFLERMRQTYLDPAGHIPAALRDIVNDASAGPGPEGLDHSPENPGATSMEPLLLPLATNEQQQRILRLAQTRPGVTVQGPPGTGKSHTIANLISHYVASGQRVLVVAEKEQALRVLADKVPEGIRDLTVSVLGADEQSRKQLEKSISNIQAHVSTLDKKVADQEIQRLRGELDAIDRGISRTTQEMFEARQLETTVLSGDRSAGQNLTPQQAGEWLRENAEDFAYIDDSVTPATPAPLAPAELQELVDLLGSIGMGTAAEALQLLPDPSDLPMGGELEELFRHKATGHDSANAVRFAFRSWPTFTAADPTAVEELASDLDKIASRLEQIERSAYAPVLLHASDPLRTQEWALYLERLGELRQNAYALRRLLLAHEVPLPDPYDQTVLQRLEEARDALAAKGKLGLFDRHAKRALELFTVDGRTPTTVEDVSLCIAAVSLSRVRGQLLALWRNHSPAQAGGPLAAQPEDDIAAEISTLGYILEYPTLAAELDNRLFNVGYGRVGQPGSTGLAETSAHLRAANRWHEVARSVDRIEEIQTALTAGAASPGASPLHQHLAQDLSTQDFGTWDEHRENVLRLLEARPAARRLLHLRSALAAAAPLWAARIVEDPAAARNPLDLDKAWEFRQLESWLEFVTAKPNPGQLQAQIDQLSARRRKTITAMVSEMAWRRLADNLGPKERQALQSYIQATKKYGKTGGKFAQRWINEMRRSLDESSSAVPAWIMTTSRALTSFRPEKVPPFDVLIIDEASQIGFEALPLLSLSKTTIVVGDDKQTSPENVGLQREQVFDLMDDYLSRVPNYRLLFDPDNSLYDLAVQKFSTPIMLTEHFRCLPEIIAFSNQHAYNGLITPLRDRPPVPGWAALGVVKVRDGYRQGDINEPEAQQVVELIVELCGNPDYEGMTFGIVSLLGSSQSKLIWDKLYDRLGPEEMEARQVRCGEAANFQGDERDVIIITTVVAVDPSLLSKRIGAMTGVRDLRRINVAASRAKNQMWVVTSVEPDQLPNGDFRAELIRHCRAAGTTESRNEDLFEACDSEFEVRVVRDLLNRGYKGITVQHKVGQYRLDIVVSGPNGRLAVECDGDRWHGPDVWHRDRARQEILERAGWTFQRIRGSAYFRDPEAAMQPVWERLDALGIPTGDEWMTDPRGPIVREVFAEHIDAEAGPVADFALWTNELTSPEFAGPADGNQHPVTVQGGPQIPDTERPEERPVRTLRGGHIPEDTDLIGADVPPADDTKPADALSFSEPDEDPGEEEEYASKASAEDGAPEVETAGGPIRSQGLVQLSPYEAWSHRPLPAAGSTNTASIQLGLIDIVGAEGPMIARQAYLRYVQASGGQRVGSETKRLCNQAVAGALRAGKLMRLHDGVTGVVNATLYIPSQPQVKLRTLGPRTIFDVPASELRTLMEKLTAAGVSQSELAREVLNCYGLRKLTQKTLTHILKCQDYSWTESKA